MVRTHEQGVLSGTPGTAGTYTFTVKVTDANNLSSMKQLSLTANSSPSTGGTMSTGGKNRVTGATPLSITTSTVVHPGKPKQHFQQMLVLKGGTAPYTWSIVHGTLPPGIWLNDKIGEISGTTAQTEQAIVTVKVIDGNGVAQQKQMVIDALPAHQGEIVWESPGLYAQNVPLIAGKDAGVETTYMPIWYVMQLLKPVDITSTWDGKHWHMTTTTKADLSNITAGSGNTGIYSTAHWCRTSTRWHRMIHRRTSRRRTCRFGM